MRPILSILFICAAHWLSAQGWQRYYGGERVFALHLLPDGSMATVGSDQPNAYFLHADAWGAPLYEVRLGGDSVTAFGQLLFPAPPIGAAAWQLWGNTPDGQVVGWQLGPTGQPLQYLPALANATLYGGTTLVTGTTLLCGATKVGQYDKAWTMAFSANGSPLWARSDSIGLSAVCHSILPTPNGGSMAAGTYIRSATNPDHDFFLQKLGTSGNLTTAHYYEWPGQQQVASLLRDAADNFVLVGSVSGQPGMIDDDIWVAKISPGGDSLWSRHLALGGYQVPRKAVLLPNGHIALTGETRTGLNGSRDAFLALLDATGNLLLYRTYGGIKGDIAWDLAPLPDGGFALAGQSASFGDGTLRPWLLRTDAQGNVWQRTLHGRLTHDTQENCVADSTEGTLPQWLVTAAGNAGTYYATTDSMGRYAMPLDTGLWFVSVLPLASVWQPCEDSVAVLVGMATDSVALDFSVQNGFACPLLEVQLSASYLRRCFDNQYAVQYYNHGNATATDAQVVVHLDHYLSFMGSAAPHSLMGDSLVFHLGHVPPLSGGGFQFVAYLDCDSTVLGQMHCTTAHILPDSVCGTLDPNWDGAHLDVEGYCAGDSVVFTITNTGAGGMNQPVEYVITEDQIIFKLEAIQLAVGESVTVVVYPNGSTVTLTVPQTPGHPSGSQPMLVIEGCGGAPFTTGYAYQFPANDGDPSTDVDCRSNIGSFDPNDKQVLPIGVGADHVVQAGDALQYLIRFQNTGTDTAFRVEVRDTLDKDLDPSTLSVGTSSHAFRWEVMGNGMLRFIFDPILLPDSSADWAGSQGFVQYSIKSRRPLLPGTRLENSAGIYFDFNAPVLTNTVFHTIGNPVSALVSSIGEWPTVAESPAMTATPHPFGHEAQLAWPIGVVGQPYRLRVFDMLGQLLLDETLDENKYTLRLIGQKNNAAYGAVVEQGGRVVGRMVLARQQ